MPTSVRPISLYGTSKQWNIMSPLKIRRARCIFIPEKQKLMSIPIPVYECP